MGTTEKKGNTKIIVGWTTTILLTLAIVLGFKDSTTVTWNQTLFMAVTLFYILITAFELLNNLMIAILLPATYLFFKLAPAATIYSSWSNNVVWLCITGMIIANVLGRIGLLRRFVYWCVLKLGSNYRNIVVAFGVATIVINIVAPSGGYVIFAAVVYSLCQSLHLEGTRTGTGLMLAACLSCGCNFIYSPSGTGMAAANAATVYEGFFWDYASFFIQTAPYIVPFFITFLIVPILFKEDAPIDANIIQAEYDKLGSMSLAEKKGLVIACVFVVSIMTTSIHGVGILYCFILAALAMFLPGIDIGSNEDVKKVNYSLVFFIASFISIGSVATATKFTDVITAMSISVLGSVDNIFIVCGVVFLLAFLVNFVMTPLAMIASLVAPLAQVAVALSLPIYPVILSFLLGSGQALLPYEIAKFLVFYAFGLFNFKDFAKLYGARTIIYAVWLIVVMVPYWKLIGIA